MKYIRRLIFEAKDYYWTLFGATAAIFAYTVTSLLGPGIISTFIDLLAGGADSSDASEVKQLAMWLVGIYFLKAMLRLVSDYWAHYAAWNIVAQMRITVYEHLQTLSLGYFSDKRTGQIMSRVVNDTAQFELLIAHALPNILSSAFIVTGVAVLLLLMQPALAVLTFLPVPFMVFFSLYYTKKMYPAYAMHQKCLGDMNAVLHEQLSGMREIQLFGRQQRSAQMFRKQIYRWRDAVMDVAWLGGTYHPTVEGILSMGSVIIVGIGGSMAVNGILSVGDIVRFLLYLGLFYAPVTTLVTSVDSLLQAEASAERVYALLEAKPDIIDKPDAITLSEAYGHISFKDVEFGYGAAAVLENISFDISPGTMVAIVGPTGAGKTTIAALISRLYDPRRGSIFLDGLNLRDISVATLRKHISVVSQDVFLFPGTIAENIAYGRETAAREEIIAAAKQACIHDFILSLPLEYDSLVGERGILLSGGQKQRLAIARAFLRNTPILILDEATASVDLEAERNIQQAIQQLAGSRTLIVIAHRLSTVRRADQILVVNDAGIAERGTHAELLTAGGLYARLCAGQIA